MGLEMPSSAKEEQDQEGVEMQDSITEEREGGSEQDQRRQKTRDDGAIDLAALRSRPSILLVGPSAVGKRTLLNRLIGRGRRSGPATSESGAICHGWTIDTKYYTANVCMWTARLDNSSLENATSIKSDFGRCEALVLVFDLSNSNSFEQLKEWVTQLELGSFEILLCVGNKADRVPEHFGHAEYRRKLQKSGESSADPHPEFWDYGIERTEGSSLLDGEEQAQAVEERRRLCIEWCSDMGIEYIEACAINEIFDDCLCVDGDLQGVARIHGALSAHMWPGLSLKDGSESNDATPSNEMTSDDDSDYYVEYELLSNGSAEQWEASEWEDQWSFSAPVASDGPTPESIDSHPTSMDTDMSGTVPSDPENQSNVSTASGPPSLVPENAVLHGAQHSETQAPNGHLGHDGPRDEVGSTEATGGSGRHGREIDDMEQLMREMSNMRTNMRSMSDQHRRERAAQLALRMASMFKDADDGESDLE